ncbi:flagellar motor switch protein FliG [Sphingopyxis sp. DBS4]|uniref:flagellar motor switch protein FliG n=1 Tax=Sphingopyxis sp. DBS4 TaxID=2968500 RepID=UPI00214AB739|nr:flagellar motor switch protein FliG [Sphingopyxis sp. DBS4]
MPDVIDTDIDADIETPRGKPAIEGSSAAAILLMLLDESEAATILKHLGPEEVRQLAKSMFDTANASEGQIEQALDQFVSESRNVSALAVGADARIRTVIHDAVGNVRADNILAAVAPQSSAASLEMLRWMDVDAISALLANEHPQVGALILSVLVPDVAARAVETLDEGLQAELVLRAAQLTAVPAAAIEDLESVLAAANVGGQRVAKRPIGGPGDVAKIMKKMPKQLSERTIRALKKQDKLLAQIIEEEMFIFENLRDLDAKSLGTVLRSVDAAQLAVALKGTDADMVDRCLATMSKRASETIRDEMAEMTMVKRTDVDEAQKAIMQIVRQMASSGEIMIAGAGDDYV